MYDKQVITFLYGYGADLDVHEQTHNQDLDEYLMIFSHPNKWDPCLKLCTSQWIPILGT